MEYTDEMVRKELGLKTREEYLAERDSIDFSEIGEGRTGKTTEIMLKTVVDVLNDSEDAKYVFCARDLRLAQRCEEQINAWLRTIVPDTRKQVRCASHDKAHLLRGINVKIVHDHY